MKSVWSEIISQVMVLWNSSFNLAYGIQVYDVYLNISLVLVVLSGNYKLVILRGETKKCKRINTVANVLNPMIRYYHAREQDT